MPELNALKLGLSMGIICAASMLLITFLAAAFNYATPLVELIASFYIGYSTSFVGAILGAIYGFIDGFVLGFLLIWLYNKLS